MMKVQFHQQSTDENGVFLYILASFMFILRDRILEFGAKTQLGMSPVAADDANR